MNTSLTSRMEAFLTERQSAGTLRSVRVWGGAQAGRLNLASNDYLRLCNHPDVVAAAQEALARYGASSSASPLVTGFGRAHEQLQSALQQWFGREAVMLWNSGYAANMGVLGKLPQRGDLVLADRLIHHSMIAGILSSGARLLRYPHNDMEALEGLLAKHDADYGQVFVATESVFSMDGDCADLPAIAALKERFGFCWVLDEAHALGWYGAGLAHGCGVLAQVDVLVGTLGKALGSAGAFTVFANPQIGDYLSNVAGEFIYSTFLPPASAAAGAAAIAVASSMGEVCAQARARSSKVRSKLSELGCQVTVGDSPIVPIVLEAPERTLAVAGFLRERGIDVGAIRPPTVPEGGSRLRVSLNTEFDDTQEDFFLQTLKEVLTI